MTPADYWTVIKREVREFWQDVRELFRKGEE
jgi:hypothetical protein